jgi:hypothetical protein
VGLKVAILGTLLEDKDVLWFIFTFPALRTGSGAQQALSTRGRSKGGKRGRRKLLLRDALFPGQSRTSGLLTSCQQMATESPSALGK